MVVTSFSGRQQGAAGIVVDQGSANGSAVDFAQSQWHPKRRSEFNTDTEADADFDTDTDRDSRSRCGQLPPAPLPNYPGRSGVQAGASPSV